MTQPSFYEKDPATMFVRTDVVKSLAGLRADWEDAANGKSLLDINGSVGLLLFDVIAHLGLTTDETNILLGIELSAELAEFMASQSIAQITIQPCL